jgi:hypothetical protein
MGLVAAISMLVWHGFDRPLNRARTRWVDSRLTDGFRKDEAGADPGDACVAHSAASPSSLLIRIDKRS